MRTGVKLWLVAVALVAAWALAPAAAIGADDITSTKHDFVTTGFGGDFSNVGLCGTCHYPHNTGSAQLIWNHTLSSNALTFGASASTVAGTTLPTNIASAPGTTKNCLSCHDGSVAVGDLIKGTDWGTKMITGNAVIGTAGNISGNHPVEIPYPDQANAVYNSITSKADPTGFNPTPAVVKLMGNTAGQKGIMCASCHNPHDKTNVKFLRDPWATLCTRCHIK